MNSEYFKLCFFLLFVRKIIGCERIELRSDIIGTLQFKQIPLQLNDLNIPIDYGTGRPEYISANEDFVLIHSHFDLYHGKWDICTTREMKLISSISTWAISPELIDIVHDNKANNYWYSYETDPSQLDLSMNIICLTNEEPIYFETFEPIGFHLNGLYLKRNFINKKLKISSIYMKIKEQSDDSILFLYSNHNGKWLISTSITSINDDENNDNNDLQNDRIVAFLDDTADTISNIKSYNWKIRNKSDQAAVWSTIIGEIYYKAEEKSIYQALYSYRRKYFEADLDYLKKYKKLRNDVLIPKIGLGTGGIPQHQVKEVVTAAINLGYSLIDTAREYGNEEIIGKIFTAKPSDDSSQNRQIITRRDLFIESKVWPTQLGFHPTTHAIYTSLASLQTPYIDLYLLHWPRCIAEWDWMHCHTIEDHRGIWQDSWKALEKIYMEGKLVSIGVSNFHMYDLKSMDKIAVIFPHVLQNYARPGVIEQDVHDWCLDRNVIFQPYASGRDIFNWPQFEQDIIEEIAIRNKISKHAVIQIYMLSLGNIIIPRSIDMVHLQENIMLVSQNIPISDVQVLDKLRFLNSEKDEL